MSILANVVLRNRVLLHHVAPLFNFATLAEMINVNLYKIHLHLPTALLYSTPERQNIFCGPAKHVNNSIFKHGQLRLTIYKSRTEHQNYILITDSAAG